MAGGLSTYGQRLHETSDATSPVPEIALLLANYDADGLAERRDAVDQAIRILDTTGLDRRDEATLPDGGLKGSPDSPGVSLPLSSYTMPSRKAGTRVCKVQGAGPLSTPIASVKGVSAKMADALETTGVRTVRDLLYYFPRDHLDYRKRDRIRRLRYGEKTTLLGTVQSVRTKRIRARLTLTTAVVGDDSGRIEVRWFNQPYLEKQLSRGRRIAISGEADVFDGRLVFVPRDYEWVKEDELTHASRLVPMYPLVRGLYQKSLRSLSRRLVSEYADRVEDFLPDDLRSEAGLMAESRAVGSFHFPEDGEIAAAARRRLGLDEILSIQLGLLLRKHEWQQSGAAPALVLSHTEKKAFVDSLPFILTCAQQRVMNEIEESLTHEQPMMRLLQGEVGSGKTVLAAFALLAAVRSGFQAAIMAPTEILAQQHFVSLTQLLQPLNVSVALFVGSSRARERQALLEGAGSGDLNVLVGTHTLFQEGVEFRQLGLTVVDEQHRFGVHQRTRLRQKGLNPHLLAMTATPIPRTLALTVYGDLDISTLDELPAGRVPIETKLLTSPQQAYAVVRREVQSGRQAFVVCPLIEESSDADTKSALAEYRRLSEGVFNDVKVGILHGRMAAAEKDKALRAFRDGEVGVLVATSVIEVGIDIPNATVMVIRDAHRFGLAQLHQLRGRIGRGGSKSYCILVSDVREGPTRERLLAVVGSTDGFELAEVDLRLRGPGEFWGLRQSGIPELKVANPGDLGTVQLARDMAGKILTRDPSLTGVEHAALRDQVARLWADEADLQ